MRVAKDALRMLVARCPRLTAMCYWAGTSALSLEDMRHRSSFDLDFHTREALVDVRPILVEIQQVFGADFEVVQAPDGFGSGFSGVLRLPNGEQITVEVLANYDDVPSTDLVRSTTAPPLLRASVTKYLADKMQCIAERLEARDLVDVAAIMRTHPELHEAAKHALATQDALIVAERLLGWTDDGIRRDLAAYPDVDPTDAIDTRDLLLRWLKEIEAEENPE